MVRAARAAARPKLRACGGKWRGPARSTTDRRPWWHSCSAAVLEVVKQRRIGAKIQDVGHHAQLSTVTVVPANRAIKSGAHVLTKVFFQCPCQHCPLVFALDHALVFAVVLEGGHLKIAQDTKKRRPVASTVKQVEVFVNIAGRKARPAPRRGGVPTRRPENGAARVLLVRAVALVKRRLGRSGLCVRASGRCGREKQGNVRAFCSHSFNRCSSDLIYALSGFMADSRPRDAMAAPKACKTARAQRPARRDVKAPAEARAPHSAGRKPRAANGSSA